MITEFVSDDKRYAVFTAGQDPHMVTMRVNFSERHDDEQKTAIMTMLRAAVEEIDAALAE